MSLKGFHIVFITFSTLLAFGCGVWCLWVNRSSRDRCLHCRARSFAFVAALALDGLRLLVLAEDETAPSHLMKTKLFVLLALDARLARRSGAGLRDLHGREGFQNDRAHGDRHLGYDRRRHVGPRRGGAFGLHLWRHASIPLEPHEQLTDEDLEKYD